MKTSLIIVLLLTIVGLTSNAAKNITVVPDGSGDFKTISEAIASLPEFNYERVIINVKNGTYREKIAIAQDNVTLHGESKGNTIISYTAEASGVVNVTGDDVVVDNFTIENTQSSGSLDAFAIVSRGTRTIITNCNAINKAGNVVTFRNHKNGMYYMAYCNFTGGADILSQYGWCFIRNCKFFETNKTAALFHSGASNKDQKLVIWNSSFDGIRGFTLGKRQNDAQFYMLYCSFSDSLANKPIYQEDKDTKATKLNVWGDRYYFFECHGAHVDFPWHKNNLETAQKRLTPTDLTSTWTFDGKWDPESKEGPKIVTPVIKDNTLYLTFSEPITLKGLPTLKSRSGKRYSYDSGAGSNTIKLNCDVKLFKEDIKGLTFVNDGRFVGSMASAAERIADLTIK